MWQAHRNCDIVRACCFKLLNLWWFLKQLLKMNMAPEAERGPVWGSCRGSLHPTFRSTPSSLELPHKGGDMWIGSEPLPVLAE